MKAMMIVGVGGAAGSILRYLLQRWLNESSFPYGTLGVNLTGCLVIGLLAGISAKYGIGHGLLLFGITGFCGGFTTLSAFSLEGMQMLQQNRFAPFFIYAACTMFLGLLATFIGYKIIT